MATKFHISDDGIARKCDATKKPCRFGGDDEHYSTLQDAQKAYEREQSSYTLNSLQKTSVKENDDEDLDQEEYSEPYSYSDYQGYEFTTKTEDYGIVFKAPDFEDVYTETPEDGSEFYRFEQLDELFDEYGVEDVEKGYTLDLPLNTLQQYLSKNLVEDYANAESKIGEFSFDDEIKAEDNIPPSIMRLLIHKGEFYIIDGNHRFAAARVNQQKEFSGIVIMMNDDMTAMAKVAPHHFNRMVERKRKKI